MGCFRGIWPFPNFDERSSERPIFFELMSCALPRSLGLRGPSFGIEASRRGRDYMIAATLDSFPFSWVLWVGGFLQVSFDVSWSWVGFGFWFCYLLALFFVLPSPPPAQSQGATWIMDMFVWRRGTILRFLFCLLLILSTPARYASGAA